MKSAAVGAVLVALIAGGCVRAARPAPAPEDLTGIDAPIAGGPTLVLRVRGEVEGRPAEVVLDLAAPISAVSGACFAKTPETKTEVRILRSNGRPLIRPQVQVAEAKVEGRLLRPRPLALEPGASCRLTLGADVLGRYVLRFDPTRWRVQLLAPRNREAYAADVAAAHRDVLRLELTKDPLTDRLLAPVRIDSDGHQIVGGMVLETAAARSTLAMAAAARAGLAPDGEIAETLALPVATKRALQQTPTYYLQSLRLAPEVAVDDVMLAGDARWEEGLSIGSLGSDVWGRFEVVIDPVAQLLVASRPKLEGTPQRPLCASAEGDSSEERCFTFDASAEPAGGVRAVAAVWRPLPEGGRVYFEPLDEAGEPIRGACQLGFSFGREDRGASAGMLFPWPALTAQMPQCASQLRQAKSARLAIFDDGPLAQCPGTCVFAVHPRGRGAAACSCVTPLGPQRELNLYKRLRDVQRRNAALKTKPAPLEEPEPD